LIDIAGILHSRGSGIDVGCHGNGRLEVGWWGACIFGERDHPEAHPCAFVTADNGMATIDDLASNIGEVDGATGIA
jgi:hypothetical protein